MNIYGKLMPVSRPCLGEEEIAGIKEVFDSRWLGLGDWVKRFESGLCDYIGAKSAIAVNTGTTAIHLALDALGVNKGDEVIVPSLTFVATIQAIMFTGAKPVFCDIEQDTLNMDIEDVRKRITKKTRVIMPVHYCGLPCRMDALLDLGKERGIRIVEDAAHAFGSSYKGKKIGSFADVTCFSFDPIKNITCGEGGAVLTNDQGLAKIMYKKRILGIDKDTWNRYKHKRDWFYSVDTLGFRYHLNNINAAIGLAQLNKVERFISAKREIVKKYDQALREIEGLILLKREYDNTAFFNYIIRVSSLRGELMEFLKSRKIDSGVHYIPNHLQKFFSSFKVELPITEKVWKEIVTLPLYYEMSERDTYFVIDSIKEFFRIRKKNTSDE